MEDKHIPEAIASLLVVGLGQILKNEGRKGLLILLTFYFIFPALVYTSLIIHPLLFLVVLAFVGISAILLWGYAVVDALL